MGLSLFKGGVDYKRAILYITAYSLLTPLGVFIGRMLREVSHDNYEMLGVIMAIPVGIFLYISIVEIILEEFLIAEYKIVKFLFLLAGVGFVYLLTYIEGKFHMH